MQLNLIVPFDRKGNSTAVGFGGIGAHVLGLRTRLNNQHFPDSVYGSTHFAGIPMTGNGGRRGEIECGAARNLDGTARLRLSRILIVPGYVVRQRECDAVSAVRIKRGRSCRLDAIRIACDGQRGFAQSDARRRRIRHVPKGIDPRFDAVSFQTAGRTALGCFGIRAGIHIARGNMRQDVAHLIGIIGEIRSSDVAGTAVAVVKRFAQASVRIQDRLCVAAIFRAAFIRFQTVRHFPVNRIIARTVVAEIIRVR